LTAYDASFAALADLAGVEIILVGDSLGMVCQGHNSTLPVTLDHMRYHVESVARGLQKQNGRSLVLGDMPFGSYATPEQAFRSASVLMQAGAQMVKLEGGAWLAPTVEFLVTRGIPVCGHIGLTPQSVNTLGGYRVQGRTESAAIQLMQDALQLQNAGAQILVLEMVPAFLSGEITRNLSSCATIGIGAGVDTAGQILVLYDMLGVTQGKVPKFAHNFMTDAGSVLGAMQAFVQAVKEKRFPVNKLHAW
ncbi:MAG: 3-methyl-2-oxobutanoate hydroxymethyltransferase, partial [Limnohabitans sp.]